MTILLRVGGICLTLQNKSYEMSIGIRQMLTKSE